MLMQELNGDRQSRIQYRDSSSKLANMKKPPKRRFYVKSNIQIIQVCRNSLDIWARELFLCDEPGLRAFISLAESVHHKAG